MKPSRTDRLNSEYQRAVSEIISGPLRNKEPLLKGLISVTEADVAPDLKTAKIYVSVFTGSPEEEERDFRILQKNAGFVRRELAKIMTSRTVPAITFFKDGSMEYGSRMDGILKKLKEEEERE